MKNIIVLISGSGSNLQALINAEQQGGLGGHISLVVSNKKAAYGLERAANAAIPTAVRTLKQYKDAGKSREDYDRDLAEFIASHSPDLIVLAGWMHILSPAFIDRFPNKIINLHPALPGELDGAHAIERAYDEFKAGTRTRTGVMVHYVIPEVDKGSPILIEQVPCKEGDLLEDLESRIHSVEHEILPRAVKQVLQGSTD
ncbi:Bifunctional purine biosynthetic protein ADE5,7 [Coemansia sp. RSA 1290]|nr:phosphoribosylglycinamide formyltransferase [Coemansia mojavensis]KAJ1742742.1 phosphoribosylglycinamide formyltransferase [Coemansia sp. RSA 1086]KAJ1751353.1 phosphoribosylglycinamide formyltransferase [Coemansia sp. RSA 1821]KAJ1873107.1 phosphoribosylglycinamide formyltransferase [Coemansia sp. RSA 990]KAJ2633352.1 Bifunctional purine biosynthetic protein ADE5,7 [Coemansia sp. RSA 1290]KAJ2647798.1 phosphoribosylglycinamide formyltransferase [Coemansia sp. RSA 1250]KAJ2669882.1 phospho